MAQAPIKDIEILRGFAVLAVCLHHASDNLFTWKPAALGSWNHYFGGWIGVDIFFAISGFVIARSLLPQLHSCSSRTMIWRTIGAFWIRRAWRLLPAAWLWLLLVLLAAAVFQNPATFGDVKTNIDATVAGVLQVANVRFLHTFMQAPYGASFVYWSLSLEEQFYIVLPLLAWLCGQRLVWVLLALTLWQLLQARSFTLVVFRSDALMLGVLLALGSCHPGYARWQPARLARVPGLSTTLLLGLLALLGFIGSDALALGSGRLSAIALGSGLLVWWASYDQDIFLPRWARPAMVWLGSRSYAIYLIHVPAYFLTRELWSRLLPAQQPDAGFFWPYTLTAGTLIVLLSELNYRYVEMPCRRRGAALAQKFKPPSTSSGTTAAIAHPSCST